MSVVLDVHEEEFEDTKGEIRIVTNFLLAQNIFSGHCVCGI
jgi:hypothetical protein